MSLECRSPNCTASGRDCLSLMVRCAHHMHSGTGTTNAPTQCGGLHNSQFNTFGRTATYRRPVDSFLTFVAELFMIHVSTPSLHITLEQHDNNRAFGAQYTQIEGTVTTTVRRFTQFQVQHIRQNCDISTTGGLILNFCCRNIHNSCFNPFLYIILKQHDMVDG